MGRLFRLVWFFCLFVLLFTSRVFANNYFTDDFDFKNDSVWSYFCDYNARSQCIQSSTNVFYGDGSVTLSSKTSDFPVIFSKNILFPDSGDFSIKIKFRYPITTARGVGIGIGFTGSFPYNNLFSQFGIWNDTTSNGFRFYYNDFGDDSTQNFCSNFTNSTSDTLKRQNVFNIELADSFWHLFEVYKIGYIYSVYIDRTLNTNPIFTTNLRGNCIPKFIWFGNFIEDGGGDWTSLSLDSINISSEISLLTPTPTLIPTPIPTAVPTLTPFPTETPAPTPTPTETIRKKKIFILPGLGASWNSKAIVYGQNVQNNDWKMTPLVNNYDGLIELMDKNGLEKDKDYFVWNYDWRKSISDIKSNFNNYLNSKNLSDNDDVYLIGHSLGGVVARLWAQDYRENSNIKKVITLGSPNLGSLDAYTVWNGGKVLKIGNISSVAFNIILGLQNKGFILSDLNKIRNYVPVVKDLLPTFDYATKNKKVIPWKSMESHNNFLNEENSKVSSIIDRSKFFVGVGKSTPDVLNLGNRSLISKSLDLWPDGEVLGYLTADGDGTVLKKSANAGLTNFVEIKADHSEIPNKSINQIALEVGLSNVDISNVYNGDFSDGLLVFVGSPVTSYLQCGNDFYQENDGFILAKNKNYTDCELNLSPTDNGLVHIVLGNLKSNRWNYFENEVALGNPEKIKIDYKKAEIKINIGNKQFLRNQIKSDLEKLGLTKAIKFLDKNDFGKVAWYVFAFREKSSEQIVSQRILDNLFMIGSIVTPDKMKGNYKWLNIYTNLIENTLELKSKRVKLSRKSVLSLIQLEELNKKIDQMIKDRQYPDYSVVAALVWGYGNEILEN